MKHAFRNLKLALILTIFLSGCFNWDQYEFPNPLNNPQRDACNLHPELCDRRFDSVAFATTHNSFNYEFGFTQFFFPNQDHDVAYQLDHGVRAIMLDVYDEGGSLVVYHGFALTGSEPLENPLGQLRTFLDSNAREVVSIIFETEIDGNRISTALDDAGLLGYLHTQAAGAAWPTLGEMIESGKRLVIFTENQTNAGTPEWFHYAWGHIFDTPYTFESRADFTCELNRGSIDNSLFLVNHWITAPVVGTGIRDSAALVNESEVLLPRVRECMEQQKHIANFIAVDFSGLGDLMQVVDSVNGIKP